MIMFGEKIWPSKWETLDIWLLTEPCACLPSTPRNNHSVATITIIVTVSTPVLYTCFSCLHWDLKKEEIRENP